MSSLALDATRLVDLGLLLWRHRELLDDLLFRLETQNLLLLAGRDHWVHRVADEAQGTLEAISVTDAERAGLVADMAPALGLPVDAALRDLAAVAPEPWGLIFSDHRASLLEVVDRVTDLSQRARRRLHRGLEGAREALSELTGVAEPTVDAQAEPRVVVDADRAATVVELRTSQSSFQASLAVLSSVDLVTLIRFLR